MMTPARMRSLAAGIGTAVLVLTSVAADARSFRAEGAGASVANSTLDSNADMQGGASATTTGKSNFGPYIGTSASDLEPFDGSSFCDLDPDNGFPRGVLLRYASASSVTTFESGDQLYLVIDPAQESTLCFNFADGRQRSTIELHSIVAGGTGRFAGATGTVTTTGNVQGVSAGLSALQLRNSGDIDLVRRGKGKRSDHDD